MDAQHVVGDTQRPTADTIEETEPPQCGHHTDDQPDGLARLSPVTSALPPRVPNDFSKPRWSKGLLNDPLDHMPTEFFDTRLGHLLNDSADNLALKLLDVKSCVWREIQRLDEIVDIIQFSGHFEPGVVPELPVGALAILEPKSQVPSASRSLNYYGAQVANIPCQHLSNNHITMNQVKIKDDGLTPSVIAENDICKDTLSGKLDAASSTPVEPLESSKRLTHVARILSDERTWDDTSSDSQTKKERRNLAYQCRRLTKHKADVLETFMGLVILSNAISIGVSCEMGSVIFWMVVDTVFAVIYLLESITKLIWRGCVDFFTGEDRSWNTFEVALVVLAWFELTLNLMHMVEAGSQSEGSWVMLMFVRIFKLARVLRLVRVLKLDIFSEFMAMATGATGTMRTWFWSCVMIFFPLYLASLIFRQTLGEASNPYFQTLPMAFFTLFRCLVPGECTDDLGRPLFHLISENHGAGFAMAYIGLVMFMTFGLFNVIVAIYVENVVVASKTDDECMKKQRLRNQVFFNKKMVELFTVMWELHVELCLENGEEVLEAEPEFATAASRLDSKREQLESLDITHELFNRFIVDKRTKEIFQDLEVAEDDQANLFAMLDLNGSGTIEIEELYDGVSKLRGPARRSDVVSNQMLLLKVLQELAKNAEQAGDKAGADNISSKLRHFTSPLA